MFNNLSSVLNKKKISYFKKIRNKNFKLVNDRFDFPVKKLNSEKIVDVWKIIFKKKKFKENLLEEVFFQNYIFLKNMKYKFYITIKKISNR